MLVLMVYGMLFNLLRFTWSTIIVISGNFFKLRLLRYQEDKILKTFESKLPDQVHQWYRDDSYDGTKSNLEEMYCLFQKNWHLDDQTLETVIKERDTWTEEEVEVWPMRKLFEKECFK